MTRYPRFSSNTTFRRGRYIAQRYVYPYNRPHANTFLPQPTSDHRDSAPPIEQAAQNRARASLQESSVSIWADVQPVNVKKQSPPRLTAPLLASDSTQQKSSVPVAYQEAPLGRAPDKHGWFRRHVLLTTIPGAILLLLLAFTLHSSQKSPAIAHTPIIRRSSKTSTAKQALPPVAINRGLPIHLEIPKIQVNAAVTYMGIARNGTMEVPTNIVNVGWYKYGSLPGNKGSAVIVGHLDGLQGQPGIFSNLGKLQPGDNLSVVDTTGKTTSFVVTTTRIYDQNDQPSEIFNANSGSHLNLITCTGPWDATQHHYTKRLVVFSDKV